MRNHETEVIQQSQKIVYLQKEYEDLVHELEHKGYEVKELKSILGPLKVKLNETDGAYRLLNERFCTLTYEYDELKEVSQSNRDDLKSKANKYKEQLDKMTFDSEKLQSFSTENSRYKKTIDN